MRSRRREAEGGIILLLALFVVALFTILVLEFAYTTRVEYHIAAGVRDELLAGAIATSGIYETIAMLRADRLTEIEERDSDSSAGVGDSSSPAPTARPGVVPPAGVAAAGETGFCDHYGEDWAAPRTAEEFGGGFLTVRVIDESGKLNINTLVKELKEAAAAVKTPTPVPGAQAGPGAEGTKAAGAEEEEKEKPPPRKWGQKDEDLEEEVAAGEETGTDRAPTAGTEAAEEDAAAEPKPVRYVVDKKVEKDIIRLIETLDIQGLEAEKVAAAIVDWMDSDNEGEWEEEAYRDIEGGYPPKNAPLDVLSELLLVKSVTGDLFFGPKTQETVELETRKERPLLGAKRQGVGLRDCLTICSKTKINVNTAPPEVLACLMEEENEALVKEIVNYTKKDYFKDLNEFEEEIGEAIPASLRARIGVSSDAFQIVAEGRVNESWKQIRAYVSRDEEANMKILEWRIER